MTVIAVLADPPREGLVLSELAATSPLSEAEAADLYAAMLRDVLVAVDGSGGDLLVNYRDDEDLPAEHRTDTSSEAALRAIAADALGGTEDVRFEVQVGSSFDARAGNTVTYLLREEDASYVAVVRPTAPFLARTIVDGAAMKLRTTPVVVGPSTRGRIHYAAFAEPIDFEGALVPPAVSSLTDRAREAGHDVEFLETMPTIRHGRDLLTALPLLSARRRADHLYPEHTAAVVEDLGLGVAARDGELRVVRE